MKYILLNAGFILVREIVDPEINPRWRHTIYPYSFHTDSKWSSELRLSDLTAHGASDRFCTLLFPRGKQTLELRETLSVI